MRHRDPLSPDEARELDALDRALAGEPVDADLRELEQLVHDLRATAPPMSPAFADRLERELAEGFPASGPRPKLRRPRRWVLLPAAGTLAVALVALVVVVGQSGRDNTASPSSTEGGSDSAAVLEDSRAGGAADGAAPPARSAAPEGGAVQRLRRPAPSFGTQGLRPPAVAKADGPRKVQRTADLVLETPAAKLEATSDDVIRTVEDRFDGIIASSSTASDDASGGGGEATFDLRIPTDRLDDALAALSTLGHVAERRQNLQDITASFSSVQDRLSDARAERRGLLRALGRATTQAQIDSLRARLRIVRGTISRRNGDLASLRRRADLSRVSVTVRAVQGSGGGASGGRWSPGDAARDALRILEVMAGVAVIALAIALPLGLLGVAIALAARTVRRRDRERALDPA